MTKSWEEYINKRKRGYFMGFARTIDVFFKIFGIWMILITRNKHKSNDCAEEKLFPFHDDKLFLPNSRHL